MKTYFGIALLIGLGALSPAQAYDPTVSHVYTQIDTDRSVRRVCRTISSFEDGSVQRCPSGPGGWRVTNYYADARDDVVFGRRADDIPGVSHFIGGFPAAFGVIEWRLRNGRPFAAIHRYSVGDPVRQVLTVHRLQPDKTSCIAAVVAVRKGFDANLEAAEIADSIGETFRCGRDRIATIGSLQ